MECTELAQKVLYQQDVYPNVQYVTLNIMPVFMRYLYDNQGAQDCLDRESILKNKLKSLTQEIVQFDFIKLDLNFGQSYFKIWMPSD